MATFPTRTRGSFLFAIYLAALAVRLAAVLLTHNLPIGLDDMYQYDMLARSIVLGNDYRWYAEEDLALIRRFIPMEPPPEYDPRGVLTSHRGVGYPAFLALVYAVSGLGMQRLFVARLAQAFLVATLAPMTWALARRAGFGDRSARWASTFMAFYPLLIAYPLALVSENLFIPLVIAGLVLTLRAAQQGKALDAILAGLVFGCAALTRSIIAGLAPLAAIWLWRAAKERRTALRNGAWLVFFSLLVTTPWAVRNTILHRRLTWLESSLGYNLYLGYHPASTGTFQAGISFDLLPILDDAERDARGMQAFWNFVRADSGRVPDLMIRKLGYFWGLDRRALTYFYSNGFFGYWPPWLLGLVLTLDTGPLVLLIPLAAVGLVCGPMHRRKTLLLLALTYYTGVHTLILAEPRFHLPLLPILAILAAYALFERPWRESRPWQRGVALALIVLLLTNWVTEIARDWDILAQLFGPDGYKLHLSY